MLKYFLLFQFFFISICFSQESKSFKKNSNILTAPSPGINFDILHYRIDLDWVDLFNSNNLQYTGSSTLWIVPDDTLSFVRLQYGSMNLVSASVNDNSASIFTEPDGMFTVRTPVVYSSSDTVKIKINFIHHNNNQLGIYFYFPSESLLIPEKVAYTTSEPFDSRHWYPCYNYPDEKATIETHTRVPSGYTVSSNGLLQSVTDNGDNTKTFFWKSKDKMASYLAVVNASRFDTLTQYYKKITSPNDSIPVLNYFWAVDRNGFYYNALNALKNIPKMMTVYSGLFGEYPFEKYGHTIVDPFRFGGMEHQSITTSNRAWLYGNDNGFAHELTHQWFGDLITCNTFMDIWLNEGFATYGEFLWNESIYGNSERKKYSELKRSAYLSLGNQNTIPVYNPPEEILFNYATTYLKGGLVLQMFRKQIGDEKFFGFLKYYVSNKKYRSVTTEEFISTCNEYLNQDYSWFFNQWIYYGGHPKVNISWGFSEDSKIFAASIGQQSGSGITYKFQLDIKLKNSDRDSVITLTISKPDEVFTIPVGFPVNSIQLDPDAMTLFETGIISNNLNGLLQPGDFSVSSNYPNPFNGQTTFIVKNNFSSDVRFEVYDISGRKISEDKIERGLKTFTWTHPAAGNSISSSVYIYRFSGKTFSKTGKMIYLK